jgi:hypothetical protein
LSGRPCRDDDADAVADSSDDGEVNVIDSGTLKAGSLRVPGSIGLEFTMCNTARGA